MRWTYIRSFCLLSACLAWGCAVAEDLVDGGTTQADMQFGCLVARCDGPSLPPPVDMAAPDPEPEPMQRFDQGPPPDAGPMIPDECDPGTRIAACALCNLQGMPEMPESDASCPAIDCGGDVVYERVVEGEEEVCYVTRRTPLVGNCRALGECHDDPVTFCGEPSREEVERVIPGPCLSMVGCEGDVPPSVEEAPPGAPCNGSGVCNVVGECTVSEACGSFFLQGNSQLCGGGTEVDGAPYCEFYVEPGGETDCTTFCLSNDWRCRRAWNDDGVCVPQNQESDCGRDYGSFVCRCVPPP